MFCKNCGAELSDTAKFCKKCGAQIDIYTKQIDNEETSKPKHHRGAIKAIILLAIIAVILIVIECLGIFKPETVVLKMANGIKNGDYDTVVACMDPETEMGLKIMGGITAGVVKSKTQIDLSWGQLMYLSVGKAELDIMECYCDNKTMKSNIDVIDKMIPSIPLLSDLLCTEADVNVKFQCLDNGKKKTGLEKYHVKKYGLSGWRVDGNQVVETQWLD